MTVLGPDLRMVTTPENPGLYVYAPVDPRRPFARLAAQPVASYACRCGHVRRGRGRAEVDDVIRESQFHPTTCTRNKALSSTA